MNCFCSSTIVDDDLSEFVIGCPVAAQVAFYTLKKLYAYFCCTAHLSGYRENELYKNRYYYFIIPYLGLNHSITLRNYLSQKGFIKARHS